MLRGLALYGVMAVNLTGTFRIPLSQNFAPGAEPTALLDRLADGFIDYALQGKALTLFAFLFGAGLAIQFERFARAGDPLRLLRRRLLVLLAFGLAHLLLAWNGDILTEYAIAGLIVVPFLARARGSLAAWSLRLFGVALVSYLGVPLLLPDPTDVAADLQRAYAVYGSGSFWEIRRYSLEELAHVLPITVGLFPQTLALFLLGAWAWRSGLLREPASHRALLVRVALVALPVGFALTAMNVHGFAPAGVLALAALAAMVFAPVVVAAGYGAAFLLAMERPGVRQALRAFAPLGRMAFTNYILQSLAFGWIFFGYGLGLIGRLGVAAALALGTAFFAAQMAFSAAWLRRWRFGPLEWAWRSLTYGEAQPMRRR